MVLGTSCSDMKLLYFTQKQTEKQAIFMISKSIQEEGGIFYNLLLFYSQYITNKLNNYIKKPKVMCSKRSYTFLLFWSGWLPNK